MCCNSTVLVERKETEEQIFKDALFDKGFCGCQNTINLYFPDKGFFCFILEQNIH